MGGPRLDHFRGGTGEPLVLLHGLFQSWHDWSPLLSRLTAEREVLAPTHLGHPGSRPFEAGQKVDRDLVLALDAAPDGPALHFEAGVVHVRAEMPFGNGVVQAPCRPDMVCQ